MNLLMTANTAWYLTAEVLANTAWHLTAEVLAPFPCSAGILRKLEGVIVVVVATPPPAYKSEVGGVKAAAAQTGNFSLPRPI